MSSTNVQTITTDVGQLTYRESNGSGPPVVFIHGNSSSSATWAGQLSGPIGAAYRCIAIDLPGHGQSTPYETPDHHSMPGYAGTIRALTSELSLEGVALVGWSLGGHVALETLTTVPNVRGALIFGTPPVGKPPAMEAAFLPNPAVNLGFTPELTSEEAATYAASFLAASSTLPLDSFVADVLATAGAARVGLGASVAAGNYTDELEIVSAMTQPLAILQGVEEQLVSTSYLQDLSAPTLWKDSVRLIDGVGHAPHHEAPTQFDEIVLEFLKSL